MSSIIRLAVAYLCSQWKLSVTLIVIISLSVTLPIATNRITKEYERELSSRSESPPLLLGARGDRFDLVLKSQFYVGELQQTLTYGEFNSIDRNEELVATPLHLDHSTNQGKWPVVGTTSTYLTAKSLVLKAGQTFAALGTCVIGAGIAESLSEATSLKTDLANPFGLGDMLPYELEIVGVLEKANSPDDFAVFISLETAWVLDGYGHLHDDSDVGSAVDRNSFLKGVDGIHIPSSSQTRLTAENRSKVHFHGNRDDYRISSIAIWPMHNEASALLQAKYIGDRNLQVLVPSEEFQKLMDYVFQVRHVLNVVFAILAVIAVVMVVTSIVQALQLRKQNLLTMQCLGCSRFRVNCLLLTELSILVSGALMLSIILVVILESTAPSLLTLI